MEQYAAQEKILWINCAKLIAILTVLIELYRYGKRKIVRKFS